MKKAVKSVFLKLFIAVVISGLMACSSTENNSSPQENKNNENQENKETTGEDVELTMWLWPGMGFTELAKEYEEQHPNIKITIQEAEYHDTHQNLITSLAAGSGAPDIAAVDEGYLERMKEHSQHFTNLLDFGAADLKEDYLEWKWRQASNADESFLIGIPTDVGPMAMAYRVDIFEKAGLPTDPDEVSATLNTWGSYLEAGKKVKETTGASMFNHIIDLFQVIREQGEKQYFESDNTLIIEESEQIKKAWNYAVKAQDIHANIQRVDTEWGAALANGDYATVFLPPWMLQNIKNDAPDTSGLWNIALIPEGAGNWGGSFLTVPNQSENAKEAYEFITWLMSPENQLRIFESNGNFPSAPSVYQSDAVQSLSDEFFNREDLGAIFSESALLVDYVYRAPHTAPINQIVEEALVSIADGQATPEEAWETAVAEVKRQINR